MGKPVTMTENRLAIRRAFLDGKINAVCGYPGIRVMSVVRFATPEEPLMLRLDVTVG